jgi:hypothetical protein
MGAAMQDPEVLAAMQDPEVMAELQKMMAGTLQTCTFHAAFLVHPILDMFVLCSLRVTLSPDVLDVVLEI